VNRCGRIPALAGSLACATCVVLMSTGCGSRSVPDVGDGRAGQMPTSVTPDTIAPGVSRHEPDASQRDSPPHNPGRAAAWPVAWSATPDPNPQSPPRPRTGCRSHGARRRRSVFRRRRRRWPWQSSGGNRLGWKRLTCERASRWAAFRFRKCFPPSWPSARTAHGWPARCFSRDRTTCASGRSSPGAGQATASSPPATPASGRLISCGSPRPTV